LRKQNPEGIGNDGLADGLRNKDHLPLGERLEHERREVSIFSEQEEVLWQNAKTKRKTDQRRILDAR